MTNYIATYFNYFSDVRRRDNTLEFCKRYPNVLLIQGSYTDDDVLDVDGSIVYKVSKVGFIDYYLINKWLSEYYISGNVVIMDTDLILEDGYFLKMEKALLDYDFVSGFNRCYDIADDKMIPTPMFNKYKNGVGHCGFIYGYSERAILRIYRFPEYFLIGGFDYALCCVLMRIPFKFDTRFNTFKEKILHLKFTWLDAVIFNKVHRNGLLTDFKLYSNLTEEVIKDFMLKRIS